jgi:hypothetical protein
VSACSATTTPSARERHEGGGHGWFQSAMADGRDEAHAFLSPMVHS